MHQIHSPQAPRRGAQRQWSPQKTFRTGKSAHSLGRVSEPLSGTFPHSHREDSQRVGRTWRAKQTGQQQLGP